MNGTVRATVAVAAALGACAAAVHASGLSALAHAWEGFVLRGDEVGRASVRGRLLAGGRFVVLDGHYRFASGDQRESLVIGRDEDDRWTGWVLGADGDVLPLRGHVREEGLHYTLDADAPGRFERRRLRRTGAGLRLVVERSADGLDWTTALDVQLERRPPATREAPPSEPAPGDDAEAP